MDEAEARKVLDFARERLSPDPFGDAGGAYDIHTLYLDTPALDVYHRSESFRRRKFRIRRYGDEDGVHLEQKTRSSDRVSKRRTPVAGRTFAGLGDAPWSPEVAWSWFHRRVLARRLIPIARVSYVRTAWIGTASDAALRLTLDDHLRAAREDGWRVTAASGGTPLLAQRRVLELKYQGAMPTLFKDLVARFGLSPRSLSKYRVAVDALGIGDSREAADA